MATTIDLACTACAWVDKDNPTVNYHGAVSYPLGGVDDNLLFLSFETLPQQFWGNKVDSVNLVFTVDEDTQSGKYVSVHGLSAGFSESSVTYDTKPYNEKYYSHVWVSSGSGDKEVSFDVTAGTTPENIHLALHAPAFSLSASSASSGQTFNVYTTSADPGKRPVLRVVVSDSLLYVQASENYPPSSAGEDGTVLADEPVSVSWNLAPLFDSDSGYGPIQTSAVFKWSMTNEAPWNETEVSGPDQSVSFPAGTFPAHGVVYWRVNVTCYGGRTVLTSGYFRARLRADLPLLGGANVSTYRPDETWTWEYTISSSTNLLGPKSETVDLFSFGAPPQEYAYNAIYNAGVYFKAYYTNNSETPVIGGDFYELAGPFDADRVTWNTKPGNREKLSGWTLRTDGSIPQLSMVQLPSYSNGGTSSDSIKANSLLASKFAKAGNIRMDGPTNSFLHPEDGKAIVLNAPLTLRLWFLDLTVTSKPSATTNASGYVNPHVAQTFRWDLIPDGDYWCVAGWTTASATLYWRQAGAETWNSVAAAAGSSEVILAANTLPVGSVEWYVTATDDQGTTASSEIYTINTADTLHTATPVYPIDTTENGDAGIRFIWTDASDTGAAPTGADLQYSADQGATWTDFASPRTSATQYDAPGGGFPSGVLLWRVRSLNAEGTAGPWSEAVSFLCFAAPDPPILDSDGKPFLTVTWQSSGQRAYRVTVDGKAYGPYFGDGKSFTVPEFLTDGSHTVRVEIQNEYGLWNGSEITVTVANVPGSPVILSGSFDRDAALRWTCEDATADFLIYRDDVQIGHSSGYSFTDRTVLDFHTWRVINRLPGGYYTASNTVSGTLCTEGLALALLAGGPWIDLTLSTNAIRTTTAAAGRSVVLRQFAGREYPDAEAAPYKTLQISFDVSWTPAQTAQARAFEALIGEAVIFKEPGEEAFVGVLSAFQRSHSFPARSYTATVQRIHWREYVDADS